jgi:hypothetical protein
MSNGSQRVSAVAMSYRQDDFWTETDLATTYFEGGWYLIVVWTGFRLWVIWNVVGAIRQIRDSKIFLVAAGLVGFVIVTGLMGTLGIQPPLAIWFWLAVGLVFVLAHHDRLDSRPQPPGEFGRQIRPLRAGLRWVARRERTLRRS